MILLVFEHLEGEEIFFLTLEIVGDSLTSKDTFS